MAVSTINALALTVEETPPPKHAVLRDSANNLDYVVITWPSTGTRGGVMIVAKSLRYMVPATRFELVTP